MKTPDSATDNNVVRKTSDEIKKGLECCGKGNACRGHCPYDGPENGIKGCTGKLSRDALALINRLEGDNIAKAIVLEQLEREKKDLLEERELNDFLRDKVQELEAQLPKWISVDDRLPERHGQQCVGLYNHSDSDKQTLFPYVFTWHAYGHNGYVVGPHFSDEGLDGLRVHYWMPLPEMPKEELCATNA